jgi:hypothetical protein
LIDPYAKVVVDEYHRGSEQQHKEPGIDQQMGESRAALATTYLFLKQAGLNQIV